MAKFKQPIDEKSVAISLGLLGALVHLIWIIAVQAGGQGLVDRLAGIHFVSSDATILPFDAMTAIALIVVSFVAWAIMGWLFAVIWNWCVKRK